MTTRYDLTERPTRDDTLLKVAHDFAERSTCSRAQVGVAIGLEGRVLVTGYNGAPAGMKHCDHSEDPELTLRGDDRSIPINPDASKGCQVSVHAEANAIAYAARFGIRLEGATLYSTYTPCLPCAQLIINSGIVRVLAVQAYRDPSGTKLLEKAGFKRTGDRCWSRGGSDMMEP